MPSYAKILKEVLSNKRKLPETGVQTLSGECSAILECKVPKKEVDLRGLNLSLSTTSTTIGGEVDSCLLLGKVTLLLMKKVAPHMQHLHPHHHHPMIPQTPSWPLYSVYIWVWTILTKGLTG